MNEWQKIETAPRDGTPILLLSPDGFRGIGYLEIKGFEGHEYLGGHAAWIGTRAYEHHTSVYLGGHRPEEATHWQPLPAALGAAP